MDFFKGMQIVDTKTAKLKFMTIHFQVELGCDCCELNGELVPDKHNWTLHGKTYGKNLKKCLYDQQLFYNFKSAVEEKLF